MQSWAVALFVGSTAITTESQDKLEFNEGDAVLKMEFPQFDGRLIKGDNAPIGAIWLNAIATGSDESLPKSASNKYLNVSEAAASLSHRSAVNLT